jgi:hypothetical protein
MQSQIDSTTLKLSNDHVLKATFKFNKCAFVYKHTMLSSDVSKRAQRRHNDIDTFFVQG